MAVGCGKVVIGGARASCAMLSRAILARMVSKGAARRAHSACMRQIATSTWSGGSTSAIMQFASARHCCAAASSWHRLSLANAGAADTVASPTRSWSRPFYWPMHLQPTLQPFSHRLALQIIGQCQVCCHILTLLLGQCHFRQHCTAFYCHPATALIGKRPLRQYRSKLHCCMVSLLLGQCQCYQCRSAFY